MTDTPQMAASRKVKQTAEDFQIASVRLSGADEAALEHVAQLYVRRMTVHQQAVEQAKEAFKDVAA